MESHRSLEPLPVFPLVFKGIVEQSAFRWTLKGIEVSRGLETLFVLSIDGLRHLLEIHLATARLHAALGEAVAPQRPVPTGASLPPLVRRHVPSAEERAVLRQARRARRQARGP